MKTMSNRPPSYSNFYALTTEAKEQIFITELLKNGIEPHKAAKAAKIIAAKQLDEPMTSEEAQLVERVCKEWLKQRKRRDFIDEVIQTSVYKGMLN